VSCCRSLARAAAFAAALGVLAFTPGAFAAPQWSAGIDPSLCTISAPGADRRWVFCGDVYSDLILGRERERDFGVGPYLGLGTVAFEDLRARAGASLHVPAWEDFAFVLSGGGLLDDGGQPGIDAALFFGIRSYNFHGAYNFAGGVVLDAQKTFGDDESTVVALGLRVDGLALAVPFLLLWGALQ
jgi:hypothetical protein